MIRIITIVFGEIMFLSREDYAITIIRIALGIVFLAHAILKFAVFGMAGTAIFFNAVGIWSWLAWPVTVIEFVVGMSLIIGFYSRIFSIIALPIILGATWVHWPNGWVFSAQNGGWEYPAFLIVALIAVITGGPGRLSTTQD